MYTAAAVRPLEDNAVVEAHRKASQVWPDVRVALARFRDVLEAALAATEETVDRLHAGDLYLVAACLDGDAHAVAALEGNVLGEVRASVERACRHEGTVEDAIQTTLTKLLVGPPGPKLAQYTGRGSLVAWVRVAAVREALQAQRRTKREILTDEHAAPGSPHTAASVELKILRDLHGPNFGKAVEEAMRRLTAEQRALLRFHMRDGLTIDRIALMFGIHRATAARRLEKARGDVLAHTTAVLKERHGLSESEVKSLCLALGGDIDLSLCLALGAAAS